MKSRTPVNCIETQQTCAPFRHANGSRDRWRTAGLDLPPQALCHAIEALDFQRATLCRPCDGGDAERVEFRADVAMRRVDIDAELPADLAVRSARLPQLERARATFGDLLDLTAPSSTDGALRVCGVAP
jgi:hypothetical protein